jgi:hypothetical protein
LRYADTFSHCGHFFGAHAAMAADRAAREKKERLTEHGKIVPLCREARMERDRLVKELEKARRAYDVAQDAEGLAQAKLSRHLASLLRPDDYPSDEELAEKKKQGAQLQVKLQKSLADFRKANQARTQAQMDALKAEAMKTRTPEQMHAWGFEQGIHNPLFK